VKVKPKTPYQRLLEDVQDFATRVKFAHRKTMWIYPKKELDGTWNLDELYERVAAADQLGYDVRLISNDEGLLVQYIKRPEVPFQWA